MKKNNYNYQTLKQSKAILHFQITKDLKDNFLYNASKRDFNTNIEYLSYLISKDNYDIKNIEPFEDNVITILNKLDYSFSKISNNITVEIINKLQKNQNIIFEILIQILSLQNEVLAPDDLQAPLDEDRIGIENAINIFNTIKGKLK